MPWFCQPRAIECLALGGRAWYRPLGLAIALGCLLLGGARAESARHWVDAAVAAGFSRGATADELTAELKFEEFFAELTTPELLTLLEQQGLFADSWRAESVVEDFARGGQKLERLRADGVLTLLATADGGSRLKATAPVAKQQLAAAWQADRWTLLDAMAGQRLLALIDDRIAAPDTQPRPMRAFVFDARDPAAGPRLVAPIMLTAAPGPAGRVILTSPVEVANATRQAPPGCAYLHTESFHLVLGQGFRGGLIDPVDAEGRRGEFYLPFMDRWEAIIHDRFDAFFRRLRDLGGRVDLFSLDMEDKTFGLPWLINVRVPQVRPTGRTLWQVLAADSRWPDLSRQLRAAGIESLDGIDRWYAQRDARLLIWNAVFERHRAGYLERAVAEPLARYFPDARMSNYGNYHHNQTVPAGDCYRFTESSHGIGSVVGTHQSYPVYGGALEVITPEQVFSPRPPTQPRVRWVEVADDELRVCAREPLKGVEPGQQAQLVSPLEPDGMPIGLDQLPLAWQPLVRTDYHVGGQRDDHTLWIKAPLPTMPRLAIPNSTKGLVIRLWQSYPGLVGDVMMIRSMNSTSDVPLLPWIEHPDLKRFRNHWESGHPYYAESVFHQALAGADDFLYWVWSLYPDPVAGNLRLAQILDELDPLVGFTPRETLSRTRIGWEDPYVLSGMEVAGRRVWRLTPRPGLKVTVESREPVQISIGTEQVAFPHSQIYEPPSPVSPLGFWILQARGRERLTQPADAVWQALQASSGS